MDDIMAITSQVAVGATSTMNSVGALSELSEKLSGVVERYRYAPS
jgi:hypothetical protein